jgi:hypothetical protein
MPETTVTDPPIREFLSAVPTPGAGNSDRSLRILFLVSAHNGLSQCAWVALTELRHEVTVAVVDSAAAMARPELLRSRSTARVEGRARNAVGEHERVVDRLGCD